MARIAKEIFSLEIRPWVQAATDPEIGFSTSSGATNATSVIWAEVIYAVDDIPLFYVHYPFQGEYSSITAVFQKVLQGEWNEYCWGGDFPELSLTIARREEVFDLVLSLDIAVPCDHSVNTSGVKFWLSSVGAQQVEAFAQELEAELDAVYQGRTPHPSVVPPMLRSFSFSRQINARAYDAIVQKEPTATETPSIPQEKGADLENLLESALMSWLKTLSPGAHILDVGCGDGSPMLARFANMGYQVTGIDISPKQLERARVNVPGAILRNLSPCELDESEMFDGVYSRVALLHLDPIELRVALWRIHQALKPGGHLLIISAVENRHMRYAPLDWFQGQRVWQWYYSPEDLHRAVEEHGLYEIVEHHEQSLLDESDLEVEHHEQSLLDESDLEVEHHEQSLPDESDLRTEQTTLVLFLPWLSKERLPMVYSVLARKV